MDIKVKTKTRALKAAALACAMLGLPAMAAHDVYLAAKEGELTMADGTVVKIWGYAVDNAAGTGTAEPTLPGPEIRVPAGETQLNIHLRNELGVPVSVMIPGQTQAMTPVLHGPGKFAGRVRSFTQETAPSATQTYTWNNIKPGSFLYTSGTHVQVQVQMGLYGAMLKNASDTPAQAYGPDSAFDQEATLVYSEIDPVLHEAVASGNYDPFGDPAATMTSTIDYLPRYTLINGKSFPATTPVVASGSGTVLLRYLNAGLQEHAPIWQDLYANVIAEDGNAYPYAREQYSLRLPAGGTRDALLEVDCAGGASTARHVNYDGRMRLSNNAAGPGGMRVSLYSCGTPTDTDADGIPDDQDNCINHANPTQLDVNGDGYGNRCDGDLNNDGSVSITDFVMFRGFFGQAGPSVADFNGDNQVTITDFVMFRSLYGGTPGPSAL